MCGCFDFIYIAAVLIYGAWYSVTVLIQGVLDIGAACKITDIMGIIKGLLKILAVPFIFLGIQLAGIVVLEVLYICK